ANTLRTAHGDQNRKAEARNGVSGTFRQHAAADSQSAARRRVVRVRFGGRAGCAAAYSLPPPGLPAQGRAGADSQRRIVALLPANALHGGFSREAVGVPGDLRSRRPAAGGRYQAAAGFEWSRLLRVAFFA